MRWIYGPHCEKHGTLYLTEGGVQYIKKGTTLANYLVKWIPREIHYINYKAEGGHFCHQENMDEIG
jgi:hypothetical protein